MAQRRCQAPICGRFVTATSDYCSTHQEDFAPDNILGQEVWALRYVLRRLLNEKKDVELLAKLIPRVSSVSIQAARTRHQIGAQDHSAALELIHEISEELDNELNQ